MLSKLIAVSLIVALCVLPEAQARGWDWRCTTTVDRLKQGPADWKEIIEANRTRRGQVRRYRDRSFRWTDQYYRLPWSGWDAWDDYWMYGFGYYFENLGEKYPDATLFGKNNTP